jgi:2-keto-4-pentenoate hydratase/2-oxohepta-3-ene-1,7-dioic acid hydratase in catechol pathway
MLVGKSSSAITGPYDDIVLPDPTRLPLGEAWVIPEPELGIVTRRARRHLDADGALMAIAGFVVAQDVTERRHEFGPSRGPWHWDDLPAKTLGKSLDTFCPIGPALVTLDEFTDAGHLLKRCWVNDRLVVKQTTGDMLWSAADLVALISSVMTLRAGSLCLSGCGPTIDQTPFPFLSAADEVRTEIEGIGTMVNRCVGESPADPEGRPKGSASDDLDGASWPSRVGEARVGGE